MQTDTLLQRLFNGETLSADETAQLFTAIMQGNIGNEQLAALLIALKIRGETIDEISAAATALQQAAAPFPTPDYAFADIVGTGGDGANTLNISTAAAITAAACGVKIAKHGNRSVSSQTGSSDLLAALGVNLNMSPEQARQALDDIGLCFLFAPQYHGGFKHAAPVRQALKTRTIFNILGPLINPARPTRQLLGVYSPDLVEIYAQTAVKLGHQHSIVVHGSGLDEVALHGKTDVAEIQQGKIRYYQLTSQDFGFESHPLDSLKGGLPQENARILTALLQGNGTPAQTQAVAMNTALLLKLFGHHDLKQNADYAVEILRSGKPFEVLEKLMRY